MYYFKIDGRDKSGDDRMLLIKMEEAEKPSVCDVIKYVASNCEEFDLFSYMSGPEEITADTFIALAQLKDETIFVKTKSTVTPVKDNRVLLCESDYDYTLKPNNNTVWITVGPISLYIIKDETGVQIAAMPLNRECDGEIVVGSVTYDDIEKLKANS